MQPGPIHHETCNGKNIYTKREAERVKMAVERNRGKDVRSYECPLCYGWHLTKKHGNPHGKPYKPNKDHGRH